jgi:phage terminase large subunit-like protein
MTTWIKTKQLMHNPGQIVLAYSKNSHGKDRIIRACWVAANTEEADCDWSDISVYNEADDTYYWPEGWYEQISNWGDYGAVMAYHEITHWMPMPEAPVG